MVDGLKAWAHRLKSDLMALWYCRRHPDTPILAKVVAFSVVAYALSPIDLIPDFIPVLGYVDDLLIVPLGIYIALRLIPPHVLAQGRELAKEREIRQQGRPRNWTAAAVIVAIWLGVLYGGWALFIR
jgi:uncharacterized membrane protein YkvA (DUF1232 family)